VVQFTNLDYGSFDGRVIAQRHRRRHGCDGWKGWLAGRGVTEVAANWLRTTERRSLQAPPSTQFLREIILLLLLRSSSNSSGGGGGGWLTDEKVQRSGVRWPTTERLNVD